jgi:hypothetical protein
MTIMKKKEDKDNNGNTFLCLFEMESSWVNDWIEFTYGYFNPQVTMLRLISQQGLK